jgi:VanZ family protein
VRPKIISFLPAFLWLIITFILLVLPGSDIPEAPLFNIIYFDKWVHIGLFGVLMLLWGYPFFKTNSPSAFSFLLIAVCVVLYGIIMEFVQKFFVFERSFDLFDILADSLGCLLALWLLIHKLKKLKARNT